MEEPQGPQALETEACIPYWETRWELGFRVGNPSLLTLSLIWLSHSLVHRPLTCTDGPCLQRLLKTPQTLSTKRQTHVSDDRPVLCLIQA